MTKDNIILVVGATGKQGGAVARHLLQAGFHVRGLTRNPDSSAAQQLLRQGAELFIGNLDDPASLERATTGAYGVFSVQNYWEKGVGFAGEIRQGRHLADAAKRAGVAHYVQSTMADAEHFHGVEHFASKHHVEHYVDQLVLPRTFIGTVYFMDNVLDPKMGGRWTFPVLAGSLKPQTAFHMIAVDDIGAITAAVFQAPQTFIGTKINSAGDRLTVPEMKAIYQKVAGKKPRSLRIPAWLLRRLNKEFAQQLQWHNTVGWTFSVDTTKAVYPSTMNFEWFLRYHKVANL
jgi:uncharacterized protein YbjT (DUF2867 family)